MRVTEDARVWVGGGVGLGVVAVAAAWLLLVGPELATVPAQHAQASAAATANSALAGKVAALAAQDRNKTALLASLRTARNELPIYSDLPTFITQLSVKAQRAHVTVTSLTVGTVTATVSSTGAVGAAGAAGAAGGAAGAGAATPAATPSPSTASVTAEGAGTAGTAAGAGASGAKAAGQLFQIQLTVITSGTLLHQRAFLQEVQRPGDRAALVTSTQLAPDTKSTAKSIADDADVTTALGIFVAPQTPAAAAALAKQLGNRSSR